LKWLKWGMFFSVILFIVIYFLLYKKIVSSQATVILKLGNMDVSFLKVFLSNIRNVILSSLVLGFLLGAIPVIGKKKYDPNQVSQSQLVQN
jgi:predicted cation transporter